LIHTKFAPIMIFLLSLFIFVTPSIAYNDVSSGPFSLANALSCPNDQEPKYSTTPKDVDNFDGPQLPAGAVALSGNGETLAIADPLDNVLRVYRRVIEHSFSEISEYWDQVGEDLFSNQEGTFRPSIALSDEGQDLVVGAFWDFLDNDGTTQHFQDFQLFQRNSSTTLGWTQSSLDINAMFPDKSLSSIAISGDGNFVAMSAVNRTHEDYSSGRSIHDVRVFKLKFDRYNNAIGWSQIGQDILRNRYNSFQDSNVAISKNGQVLAINAAVFDDYTGDSGAGFSTNWYASIYERHETLALGWKQIGQDLTGKVGYYYSQTSVALSKSGDVVAIGAVYSNLPNYGTTAHVRVYNRDALYGWKQVGSDLELDQSYSLSLSLSEDGNILAFGHEYSSNPTYNKGFGIFRRDPSSTLGWTQISNQDASSDGEESGWYVSLSSDGSTLAVGGQNVDGTFDSGYVKLYHVSCFSSGFYSKMTTTSTITLVISVITLALVIVVTISNYFLYRNIVKKQTSHMNNSAESTDVSQEAPTVQVEQGRVENSGFKP